MKKKCSMNTFLESVALLYLLFFAAIVHLGYFILLKETRSIILFCLVSTFVYLVIPNMVVVLGVTLIFVDMLYIVNASYGKEGFSGTVSIKDLSGADVSPTKFIKQTMKSIQETSDDEEPDTTDTSVGNTLGEIDEQSKKMKHLIDKIKSVSPEMVDSLKMINSIDMEELNKLINNMNKIATTITS